MNLVILLPTLVWVYLVFPFALIFSDNNFEPLQWGFKSDAIAIRTLHSLNLKHCRGMCNVRNSCKSYSYHRNSRMCLLYDGDTKTTDGSKTAGWVYGEKKAEFVDCQYCEDETLCNVTGTCSFKECSIPTLVHEDDNIKGNMVSVGARVVHECKDNPANHTVSECLTTGEWSLAQLQCPIVCNQLPTVRRGRFVTPGGSNSREGAIGHVSCDDILDRSFGDNAAVCQSTGYWNVTQFVCWKLVQAELDGETKQILNPATKTLWNYNFYGNHSVTAEPILSSNSTRFEFHQQVDLTYKLLTTDGFVCYGDAEIKKGYLHTMELHCESEDHMQFYMYHNAVSSRYMFTLKASDKVLKVDSERRVRPARQYAYGKVEFQISDLF